VRNQTQHDVTDEGFVNAGELTGLRRHLHSGDLLLGGLLSIPDPAVATIVGRSGFDFVVVDGEHAPFTLTSLRACVEALDPTPAWTIVRVAANDAVIIKQTLELGVDGIQVPSVRTADEALEAVRACRYAPDGTRGIGIGRGSSYGAELSSYLEGSNARTAVLVMIEDATGVANVGEIAAVEGLDGIVVGPLDLSASLGVTGDAKHPSVREAIERVTDACVAAGVCVGTGCTPEDAPTLAARGMRVLTVFYDVIGFAQAARQAVATARSETS
jgi:2-keto-3-deoxy-L-rhamnonate aldolase RhmA